MVVVICPRMRTHLYSSTVQSIYMYFVYLGQIVLADGLRAFLFDGDILVCVHVCVYV